MTIEQVKISKDVEVMSLSGRLDTVNASLLERKIKQTDGHCTELVLDVAQLTYISSMGLRVLLQAKKTFTKDGRKLSIKNLDDSVREVFEMTGFLNLMVQDEKFVVVRKDDPDCIVLSLNGSMNAENVPMLSKELSNTRKHVVLDMEGLDAISHSASSHLKKAIEEIDWTKRTFKIQKPSDTIQAELEKEGLGEFIVTV